MSLDTVIKAIEAEHQVRVKTIRDAYNSEMLVNRKVYEAAERDCARREKATIAEAVKWHNEMLRTARGERASRRSDALPAVTRTTSMHGAKVSMPRVTCLEVRA